MKSYDHLNFSRAGTPDAPQERLIHAIGQLTLARRRQLASALTEVATAIDGAEGAPVMFMEDRGRGRRLRE